MELLDLRKADISHQELAEYLANFETERTYDKDAWEKRLRFWWELNPYFDANHPKGWVIAEGKKIRGFMGAIVGCYHATKLGTITYQKSLSATTWRVDADSRAQSMQIFMRYLQAKKDFLLVDTTPTPDVEKILEAFKFVGPYTTKNTVYPIMPLAQSLLLKRARGEKISRERLAELKIDFAPPENFIERKITNEYLDWYCFESPKPKHLYGLIEGNELQAYIVAHNETFRGQPIARIVDFDFDSEENLQRLLAVAASDPHLNARFLVFTTFPANPKHEPIKHAAWALTKTDQPHYLFANAQTSHGFKWAPKMLDGDYGC